MSVSIRACTAQQLCCKHGLHHPVATSELTVIRAPPRTHTGHPPSITKIDGSPPGLTEFVAHVGERGHVLAKLADMDLFPENGAGGGIREASVLRYKEKRRTRLFSKKIRYQVRKVNADCRPRMKGRFVRSPSLLQQALEEES